MKPLLCIYHGSCADGFGAAWVVNCFCQQNDIPVEFHAGVYQNSPPDCTDRHVLLVDFSYKADVLAEMHYASRSLLVLDHHKTARDDLSMLPIAKGISETLQNWMIEAYYPASAVFDMERSGAGITWDYFYPGKPRPKLIDHIEDRDLWKFKLEGTREIQAALFSYPYDFETWDKLIWEFESWSVNSRLQLEGKAIERKHFKDINELLEVVTRPMKFKRKVVSQKHVPGLEHLPSIAQYEYVIVPVANLPYTLTSDAGHALCGRSFTGKIPEPQPDDMYLKSVHLFAAVYWDTPEGRVFSLRSRDDGADVGEIAKLYGGGGHAHAAGFRVPFDQLAQFEP